MNTPWRDKLVAKAVSFFTALGGEKLVESRWVRAVGKRVLGRQREAQVRQIASGLGRGLKLRVLPETPRTYLLGTHEPHLQKAVEAHVRPGAVVYDCGANIGYFTAIFAKRVGENGQVIAIEPSPESFRSLQQVGPLNQFHNIQVLLGGVWSRSEPLHLLGEQPDKSLVSDRVTPEGIGPGIQGFSIDELVYEKGMAPPDVIKMDIEGAEGEGLMGARRTLKEHYPVLLLEVHGEPGRLAWDVLQEMGYEARNMVTGEVPTSVEEFAIWIRQYVCQRSIEKKQVGAG